MAKQKGSIGGFAAINSGKISNSYSVLKINGKGKLASGFVAENNGTVSHSYCYGNLKKLVGGFVANDKGHTEEHCYFLHSEKEGSKALKRLSDNAKGQRIDEIKNNDSLDALCFDKENIWEYLGTEIPIGFISKKWCHSYDTPDTTPIFIEKEEELLAFADKVNNGNKEAVNAYVILKENLNLGGKEWIPIGESRMNAFCGVFDGQGHTITNFIMKDKKRENKGFFGFLKGHVYNLSVDCAIKNGNCIAGLVAQNEGGTIGCCSAVVEIKTKQGIVGGLVGKNNGTIFESYSAGKVFIVVIPIWWGLPLLAMLLILMMLLKPENIIPTFAPVPYDKDQIPIKEEQTVKPNTDGNFVSFQFQQEIVVALNTGLCNFEFKNPGDSNHNIVVQLQMTDAQAKRVMGSTGRSEKEQAKLEATEGYDPETYRTVIAESGAIRPGYQLADLRLVEFKNGAKLPEGTYNAVVYLLFYDIETNNRAMLESQLPVQIKVVPFV